MDLSNEQMELVTQALTIFANMIDCNIADRGDLCAESELAAAEDKMQKLHQLKRLFNTADAAVLMFATR